ncbi:MAG: cation-translocating P-type ATPase [Rubrivivax sp.]
MNTPTAPTKLGLQAASAQPPPPASAPPGDAAALSGLSSATAQALLAAWGPNALSAREQHGWLRTLRGVATEPMFLLLLGSAALYLVIGSLGEGLLLSFFALVTVGLVFFQERRSEHALDALRELAAPQARALRDGQWQRVPAQTLVPGDLVQLGEGERVPADGGLEQAVGLAVDESLLTGESVPVRKRAGTAEELVQGLDALAAAVPGPEPTTAATPSAGGDDQPQVSASSLVVAGHGLLRVLATGAHTQVGRIGRSLADIEGDPTPLQHQLRRLVRWFGLAALLACAALVAWYGLQRGQWLQGLLSAIALGMAMLPEEFPMALAVFLALGAWRLARIRVLARRPAVIEALGGATVLCVDKTGTLTENRMRLCHLAPASGGGPVPAALGGVVLPAPVHALLAVALQASHRGGIDPMDQALLRAEPALPAHARPPAGASLLREYPLTPERPAMAQAWRSGDGPGRLALKGAPEAVLALCGLAPAAQAAVLAQLQALTSQGQRVLGVAEAVLPPGAPPPEQLTGLPFVWQGLLGFEDPLRASVPAAVAQARGAGIAVVMITGDHAATALAIAAQAGIGVEAGALTGEQLAALDDAALAQAVRGVRVFARVLPAQKLRLVQAFIANGDTVAMTGDGVNDAPALKAAHIGIAMGQRGTDVAREAAGIVLMDDDFGSIVAGVRMGRRIFDNLRKVMVYITAIHVPIAGLALLPLLFGLPPLLLPVHVVLTEMVVDPVCSLAFESAPEDPRCMQRGPRGPGEGIVGWPMLWQGLLQGGALLAATLGIYMLALQQGRSEDLARTLAVLGLTAGNLGLVAVNATAGLGLRALWLPSARAFWAVVGVASAVLVLAMAWPAARRLLHFALPTGADLGLALGAVAAAVLLGAGLSAAVRRSR